MLLQDHDGPRTAVKANRIHWKSSFNTPQHEPKHSSSEVITSKIAFPPLPKKIQTLFDQERQLPEGYHAITPRTKRVLEEISAKKSHRLTMSHSNLNSLMHSPSKLKTVDSNQKHTQTSHENLKTSTKHDASVEQTQVKSIQDLFNKKRASEPAPRLTLKHRSPDYFTMKGTSGFLLFDKYPIVQFDSALVKSIQLS